MSEIAYSFDTGVLDHLLGALPTKLAKKSKEAASRNVGSINTAAQKIFESSILRPQERGVRPEWRSTGNFTFGTRGGGTFHGNVITKGHTYGFGYPNVSHADKASADPHSGAAVWRALEFGLGGKSHEPVSLLGNDAFAPKRKHKLPKRYTFGSPEGQKSDGSNQVMLVGKQYPVRDREGGGFEGKHFIEGAWLQTEQIIRDRYKNAVVHTFRTAFGRP